MGGVLIEVRGLGFGYPAGGRVFDGLDFTLRQGERLGLTGPNGSGKTTLFHLIMGLIKPSEGEISIFGKKRKTEEDFFDVRREIGLVFQNTDDQLFCPTVEEDIAFGPLNLGKSHAEAHRIVHETMERLGIAGLAGRTTHRLSEGEKRLVALATVIAMEPKALLLDEPTAGLDKEHAGLILKYLGENSKTFVIISHEIEVLEKAADRVFIVAEGRLGPDVPRNLLQKERK